MRKKIEISKDFLIKEYLEKRRPMCEIASQLGISDIPIKRLLKEYSIQKRGRGDCQIKEIKNYHNKEWLINQYLLKEKSILEIAKSEKISPGALLRYIRRFGITTRSRGFHWIGKKNPNFNGYKIQNNGYILDRNLSHPRAGKNGYVFRHTLVMEKHLNRYLIKGEVIHHRDGNPQNNNISNLQLFPNMSEHLKFESKLNRFAKDILFTKKYPKNQRNKLLYCFKMFLVKK